MRKRHSAGSRNQNPQARISRRGAEHAEKALIFFSANSAPLREKTHWELTVENLGFCGFALRSVGGDCERAVRFRRTRKATATRQARLRLRPGERRRAMDIVVLTRRS
jgi:hypothetical protein